MTSDGDSAYYSAFISSAISGGEPDGNYLYFTLEDWVINKQMIGITKSRKTIPNGSGFAFPTGERDWSVELKNLTIAAYGATYNTPTKALNRFQDIIDGYSESGGSPYYLWLWSEEDEDYIAIGRVSGTQKDYLKGFFGAYTIQTEGNIYMIPSIKFFEVNS